MKEILEITAPPGRHWVGDGFPVRSIFGHADDARALSPFLLLDHAGPHEFAPAAEPRGVGAHPHRGFETVTIVYHGEVEHRDSTGAGGHIGPGDVQWMTAGAGIVHEEFHSQAFTRRGGPFEMVQLWVNLPAADKSVEPGYQGIRDADIPVVSLAQGAGRARVIAGAFGGEDGPARTRTPMNVIDLRLAAGARVELPLTDGWTSMLAVLDGPVLVNDQSIVRQSRSVRFGRDGSAATLEAETETRLLLLEGEPIDEPVVAHGPFVMNTRDEIRRAIEDFQAGRFGRLAG